jgi:hypothetical protein
MTKPGQWYLDRTSGRVVYWPLPDENMTEAEVFAPRTQTIIRIQGTESKPVERVTVRGLTLSVTNTPLKAGGFGANAFEGAIAAYHTKDCALLDLEVTNVGGQGIKTWQFDDSRIERCRIHHTGACGMMPRGANAVVADNHVHDIGLTYPSAIGIWGGGKGVHLHHNTVHDTPYSAITCGGDEARIESNHIYHAMEELHDGAGIYTTMNKNVVIRGNFIHDIIDTGGYGASAYYLDEQCEGCVVEGNLSVNVARPSHNHWATGNTIRNNVFVVEGDAQISLARCADFVFEHNVIWATGGISLRGANAFKTFTNNVLYSGSGKVTAVALDKYSETGREEVEDMDGNVLADPLLLDYEEGLIRFADDSPAMEFGIAPIDVRGAGIRRK